MRWREGGRRCIRLSWRGERREDGKRKGVRRLEALDGRVVIEQQRTGMTFPQGVWLMKEKCAFAFVQ